jgi:hypothetical protein
VGKVTIWLKFGDIFLKNDVSLWQPNVKEVPSISQFYNIGPRATVESAGVNVADPEGLVRTIIFELRPVVLASVESASSGGLDAAALADRILLQLTPFVREGVQKELIARNKQVMA